MTKIKVVGKKLNKGMTKLKVFKKIEDSITKIQSCLEEIKQRYGKNKDWRKKLS